MPFNRVERNWVEHASNDEDNVSSFGSTRILTPPGTVIFVNGPIPILEEEALIEEPVTLGPYCKHPCAAKSFFSISAARACGVEAGKITVYYNSPQKL